MNNFSWKKYLAEVGKALGGGVPGAVVWILKHPMAGLITSAVGLAFALMYKEWRNNVVLSRYWAKRKDLVDTFGQFISGFETPAHIKELVLTYEVGLRPSQDKRRRDYKIRAAGDDVLLVKELRFGASGKKVPRYSTLDELDISVKPSKGDVFVVPTYEDKDGQIKAHVRFVPRITAGQHRRVTVLARWPGDWNDLRAAGVDTDCGYEAYASTDRLRIRIVMPPGINKDDFALIPLGKFDKVGTVKKTKDRDTGQWRVDWSISHPERDKYKYEVKCKRLSSVFERYKLAIKANFNRRRKQRLATQGAE